MRVAALSDVHGNLPALEAVLAEVERAGVHLIVLGGDHAAGPFPGETLRLLMALGERARFIRGNADRELAAAAGAPPSESEPPDHVAWAAQQLTDAERDFLGRLPEQQVLELEGLGPTLFCDGSPRTDMEIITAETPEERLREAVAGVEQRVVVCGHTHMQFERAVAGIRVLNPGSVGMPYEGEPGAYWALLGPEVSFKRTLYDVDAAAKQIRASGYPRADERASENVVTSPSRAEVPAFFEQLARDDPTFAGAR